MFVCLELTKGAHRREASVLQSYPKEQSDCQVKQCRLSGVQRDERSTKPRGQTPKKITCASFSLLEIHRRCASWRGFYSPVIRERAK
jgi:hypothetical protein